MSIDDVETVHVMRVLQPMWQTKTETASRLRGRIEAILGWATVSGYRKGENPARWRDHLDNLLPARNKVRAVRHQTSLAYQEMPSFMSELRQRQGMAPLALQFLVLSCVRSSDVRNAKIADVDCSAKVWTIASFSKTHLRHTVPLPEAAIAIIDKARSMAHETSGKADTSGLIFPGDGGARLGQGAMLAVLHRMGHMATSHGFRSSFRTWALECSGFPYELAELSLGHKIGTRVERSYQRGSALEKRRQIMQAWANFCGRTAVGSVVQLKRHGS